MRPDLDRLEQTVERQMVLLDQLPPASPRPECVTRVAAAVAEEAARVARRRGQRRLAGSLAAAAALFLTISLPWRSLRTPAPLADGPEPALAAWEAALDESSERLASSADAVWWPAFGDEDAELEDLLRSIDQCLSRFEAL